MDEVLKELAEEIRKDKTRLIGFDPSVVKGSFTYINYEGDPPFVIYLEEEYNKKDKEYWADVLKNNDFKIMVYNWRNGERFMLNEKGELDPYEKI